MAELPKNLHELIAAGGVEAQLGIKPDIATVRAQTRESVRKHRRRDRVDKSL